MFWLVLLNRNHPASGMMLQLTVKKRPPYVLLNTTIVVRKVSSKIIPMI